ncbi:protein-lysine methyltransferase METTL21C-like [Hippoglossus hippoglossus]|uniref:protein-lysine methyltransferase METTL21C-like n=1 Tax=Hippoglossus hippoglossus TaxID=8267 RepID=UPI00148C7B05|nr:protein-lysine methyltransferase METTL21C-like [Hippoglossus hippoglossus]
MDALSTYFVEETFCMRSRDEEEEEDEEEKGEEGLEIQDQLRVREEGNGADDEERHNQESYNDETESERRDAEEENEDDCDEEMGTIVGIIDEKDKPKRGDSNCSNTASDEDISGQMLEKQTAAQQSRPPAWTPRIICSLGKDIYHYAGEDIVIYESIDSFGAVMWPAALALCSFLDNNREEVNLQGKEVLELGAGTGLVTIVATLLGAVVTATDLPHVLSNLTANVMRNTRGRCRQLPQVADLSWSYDLEPTYPTSLYRYDYVLAADVVYHHDFLSELLATMKHFCRPGTKVIWANRVRMESDLTFTENFKKTFHTSLVVEDGDMKIFMATCRKGDTEKEWLDH